VNHEVRYYESHVTIAPVFDDRLTEFRRLVSQFGFRVADLIMVKDAADPGTPSQRDAFCTGRDSAFDTLKQRMDALITVLHLSHFSVWRAKIEAVLHDERFPHP
jgi:microcystin degradation protein MlrC